LLRQTQELEKEGVAREKERVRVCVNVNVCSGNTKGGCITVLLTSCLTGLESAVSKLTILAFICKTG
jgi:hypothetical protein